MRYLLDTNIVSYYLRRTSQALERQLNLAIKNEDCAISTLTRAELRYGQAYLVLGDSRSLLINKFLARVPNLVWTTEAADCYGKIKAELRRQGAPIGEIDTQIAAHALAENLILVTHNTKHFESIEGLKLKDWMAI